MESRGQAALTPRGLSRPLGVLAEDPGVPQRLHMGLEAVTHYLGEEGKESYTAFDENHGRVGPVGLY